MSDRNKNKHYILAGGGSGNGGRQPILTSLDVTDNGTYTPSQGVDGYNSVSVDVEPELETLNVTENGSYTSTNADGYSTVTVNVSGGGSAQYDQLIFTNTSGNTNTLSVGLNNMKLQNASYSLDEGTTWTDFASNSDGWTTETSTKSISFSDKLYVKWTDIINDSSRSNRFRCSKTYTLSGDLYNNSSYTYYCFFMGDTHLTDASGLNFHSTIVGMYWGGYMFNGCSSLTTAPTILPATTLTNYCYTNMFYDSALTTAPELPATTLASYCYQYMFAYCSSLTTAPVLPATTLAQNCYNQMFSDCTSLTTAPELPATTLAKSCYLYMFYNCTSLTTAPVLPATTLVNSCYTSLFENCSSLNYIKAMFTTEPSSNYSSYWVYGVASSGTFVKNSAATWDVTGENGVPSGWTVETANS